MPAEVVTRYGLDYEGTLDSAMVLPAHDEHEIIKALGVLGVRGEEEGDF